MSTIVEVRSLEEETHHGQRNSVTTGGKRAFKLRVQIDTYSFNVFSLFCSGFASSLSESM